MKIPGRHPGRDPTNPPPPSPPSSPKVVMGAQLPKRAKTPAPKEPEVQLPPREPPSDVDLAKQQGSRRASVHDPDDKGPSPSSRMATWVAHWTPGQIVTALTVLLGAVVSAVGGPAAFREIVSNGEATRAAIAASETKILAEIEKQRTIDQKERDKLAARLIIVNEKADYVAGFCSALNEGRPHSSVPTDAFAAKQKAAGKSKTAPWVLTETPYPKLPTN